MKININKVDLYMVLIALLSLSLLCCNSGVLADHEQLSERNTVAFCVEMGKVAEGIQNIKGIDPTYKEFEDQILENGGGQINEGGRYHLAIGWIVYQLDPLLPQEEVGAIIFNNCMESSFSEEGVMEYHANHNDP